MDKQPQCEMVRRIDAEKTIMHLTFAGRRLLISNIAMAMVCIAMIIGFVLMASNFTKANTEREQHILQMVENMYGPGVEHGQGSSDTNP